MFTPCPTSNSDSRVVCLSFLWWKVLLREGKKIFYKDPGFSQSLRFWFIKRVFCRTLLVGLWWQHTLASCSISGMGALMLPFTGYIFFLYLRTGKYRKVFKLQAEFLVRSKNQFFNLFLYPCFCQGLERMFIENYYPGHTGLKGFLVLFFFLLPQNIKKIYM